MIKKILNRLKRAPVSAIALLLFAVVISVIICTLQASNDAELRHYEEIFNSVPITVTLTHLLPSDNEEIPIQSWVLDLFTGEEPVKFYDLSGLENRDDVIASAEFKLKTEPVEFSLTEYAKDVQVRLHHWISTINDVDCYKYKNPHLNGISSLSCDKKLLPDYGCTITWKEGYDESIFDGEEHVCIVPESMIDNYDNGGGEIALEFAGKVLTTANIDGEYQLVIEDITHQCKLKIVGTYTAGDEKSIYCPVPILEQVFSELQESPGIRSFSFTLADNSRLDEFREKMSFCFAESSHGTENIPWKYYADNWYNEFFPYSLDINDENIIDLTAILEKSIKFNRIVTVAIVVLSVVSGFIVGFLMIRRRKRDIMLMRTVGESNTRVYLGFVLEQMLCILLGIIVGGAYYQWNPIDKLALFALVYFVGLSLALVIFMSKKLINSIKEDE